MTKRTVGDIIEACQEQQPATEEELRLTLLSLYYVLNMSCPSDYADRKEQALRARAEENFARKFRLMKADPATWLGPNWTPGTQENTAQRESSKRILAAFERRKERDA